MKSGSRDASRSIRMYLYCVHTVRWSETRALSPSSRLLRLSPKCKLCVCVSQVLDARGGLGREELEGAEVELRILRRLRLVVLDVG